MVDENTDELSADQRELLRILVGMMIPASDAYDVPGADDPAIWTAIVAAARLSRDLIVAALAAFETSSQARYGRSFPSLDQDDRRQIIADLGQSQEIGVLETVTAQCYYADDRVMRALGMEVRPPFPRGFSVEQGDWSLLDPVRRRAKLYRDV